MLTDKEVKHIATLARIKLTEKEEKSLKKDLSSVLEYINKLNEVDTTEVQPLYQTTGLVDSFRSDEPRGEFKLAPHQSHPISDWRSAEKIGAGMDESLNEKLIGQAPHKEGRFVKVKSVLAHK